MMKNYDKPVDISHNPNWPQISDHSYRILIIGGLESDENNVLPDFDKNYLNAKDPFEPKHQLLIKRGEKVQIKKNKTSRSIY